MDDELINQDSTSDPNKRTWSREMLERARIRSTKNEKLVQKENEGLLSNEESPLVSEKKVDDSESRQKLVTREDLGEVEGFPALNVQSDTSSFPLSSTSKEVPDFGIPSEKKRAMKLLIEWGLVVVGAVVIALLIKAFLFQAYYIPSPSMEPTLEEGNRIIVNKVSYNLHDVNRGDLVVFDSPKNLPGGGQLIKRVVALPGEFLRIHNGNVLINDGRLLEPYLPVEFEMDRFLIPDNCGNLPDESDGCRVPPDHVFVMGDNRNDSRDSRIFGPIPIDSIEGRAFLRVWPLGKMKRL